MSQTAEEGNCLHAPADPLEEKILTLGKWTFNLGGVVHDFRDVLKKFQEAMRHWTDRGPDPDSPERELSDIIARAVREGAKRATVEIGNYNEGSNGSSPQWRNWVMTMLGTLIVIGITSLVAMYATQKAMAERMDSFEHRITNLERKVWP